jgi:uncharacterized protein with GYD domain
MPTFILLCQFTDQGLRNLRQLPERARQNQERARAAGITLKDAFVTEGEYDQVIIFEAPNEEIGLAAILELTEQGNVRTRTLRAHTLDEIGRALSRVPA